MVKFWCVFNKTKYSVFHSTSIFHLNSILTADSACWCLLQLGRNRENAFRIIKMLFQMAPRSQFSTDDSVKIVTWWGEEKILTRLAGAMQRRKTLKNSPENCLQRRSSKAWSTDSFEDLKEVVSDFVDSLDDAVVRRAVRDVRPRAELCL